jgi:hypothetical protein
LADGSVKLIFDHEKPPDGILSLWQPAQYLVTNACCDATGIGLAL